jgi:hypothetical protein
MMRKQTKAVGILGNLEHFLEDVPTLDPYRGYKFKTKDILGSVYTKKKKNTQLI